MNYKIFFKKSASKELKELSGEVREKILESLETLRVNPFSDLIKFKKIKAKENLYRIRVGDYRVVYSIERNDLIIIVIKIGHRKDVYRHFD